MTTRDQYAAMTHQSRAAQEIGPHLLWAALIASLIACGIPFVMGILAAWSLWQLVVYGIVASVFITLTQATALPALERFCLSHTPLYLAIQGILCLVMQAISGDGLVQPIAFTVPFVNAALWYDARGTSLVGASYLGLMALGLLISGRDTLGWLALPVASYGALMVFMYNSTRMVVRESSARLRADQLAADLQHERAYLQRLTTINATLARDLDLARVLEHVADAGRALTQAGRARLWLNDAAPDEERNLRLAMQVPPVALMNEQPPTYSPNPAATANAITFPLFAKGHEIGVLELREPTDSPFSTNDLALLQPFADAAALAIENAQLYEQAQLSAILAERNRLARELHDTIAQGLTAVTMHLEAAQRSFERDPARTRQRLGRAHELARTTLDDVRRSVWTLAAPLIDGASLDTALSDLAASFGTRTGIKAAYTLQGPPPDLDHAAATQMLRIVQEALHNVEKHAGASMVAVELRSAPDGVHLSVCDDGVGFAPDAPTDRSTARSNGFGLQSLRERARIAGGDLLVTSVPGQGTSLQVNILTLDGDDEHTRTT